VTVSRQVQQERHDAGLYGVVALQKLKASALDTEATARGRGGNAFVVDTHLDEAPLGIAGKLSGYFGEDVLIDQWLTAHCTVAVIQFQGWEHAAEDHLAVLPPRLAM